MRLVAPHKKAMEPLSNPRDTSAARSVAPSFKVDRESEVPLRQQVADQIVYQIVTGSLGAGQSVPSVRELARRLRIHHNTVSGAYQDLVQRGWLSGGHGSRLKVCGMSAGGVTAPDLDSLINATIALARRQGFTLQQLRQRVRERLIAQPPDQILVVEEEPELRRLLQAEIATAMDWRVTSCAPQRLVEDPACAIGALVAASRAALQVLGPAPSGSYPAVTITYSQATPQLQAIRRLNRPAVVGLVSVSPSFLALAHGLLALVLGTRHTLLPVLAPVDDASRLQAADLIFCDSLAYADLRGPRRVLYRLIADDTLQSLREAMEALHADR